MCKVRSSNGEENPAPSRMSFLRGGGRIVYTRFPVTERDLRGVAGLVRWAEEKGVISGQEYTLYSMGEES